MLIAYPPSHVAIRLWGLLWMLSGVVSANTGFTDQVEISGRFSMETRLYPESGEHFGQRSYAGGLSMEQTAYMEDDAGRSMTLTLFSRYDAGDSNRTHIDLREAYYLIYGDVGNSEWEVRLGIDRVYWGVVESRPLVDIINQTDLVEHPNEKTKLGQPMAHVTWSGDWGALELFGVTWHRPRIYPGRHGRLRPELVVDHDQAVYESAAKQWHVDLAGRYSSRFGPLDVGVSLFDGTSREPTLRPVLIDSEFILVPYYEQIRQFGLDAQLTTDSWLLKLEAIHRTGAQNRRLTRDLNYEEEAYIATVAGVEYTFNAVGGSNSDLSLLAEWTYDGRGQWAPNVFENDVFLAARLGLNDEQSTELTISIFDSLENSSRVLGAELKRRLTDHWFLHLEMSAYLNVNDTNDTMYPVRRDSFIRMNLDYNF